MITVADVEQARATIKDSVRVSPCAYSESLSQLTGNRVWLKLENLQMTGSFKERGASYKLRSLSAEERARGVVCASAGNHAQGVAYHAAKLGIDATIVMPETSALIKIQNTRNYGARVVLRGTNYDEAYEEALRIQEAEQRVFVHPFDDDFIIAGQGTIGLELLEQNPYLEAIVVAVGGGGLIAGIAVAIKEINPRIRIYGVEAAAVASAKAALAEGRPVTLPAAHTLAEGIAVRRIGERPFEIIQKYVDDLVVVDDEEIASAVLTLLEREKTIAEGAGAAPIAALLHQRLPLRGKKTAAVLCGGNIDVNLISRIIERGLVRAGRLVRFAVMIPDRRGMLARLTKLIADQKAGIVQLVHDRTFGKTELNEVIVELVIETDGFDHIAAVEEALEGAGYRTSRVGQGG